MALRLTQPLRKNGYQVSSWGVKRGRRLSLTTTPPSVSRLSGKCVILDVLHSYGMLQECLYLLSCNKMQDQASADCFKGISSFQPPSFTLPYITGTCYLGLICSHDILTKLHYLLTDACISTRKF
jgi:hypothetical protein